MTVNRRKFIGISALTAGSLGWSSSLLASPSNTQEISNDLPEAIRLLQPSLGDIVPISVTERKNRIGKAQQLMSQYKMDAIFLEGTTTCFYYTGMRWGQSERTFGVVIPAKGAIAYVCPKFEEDRARELIVPAFGEEVRCWEEHESPYAVIVSIVKDRGVQHHTIGMEERVRFFIANGVKKEAAGFEVVDATPVTAGCRMIKSAAEIALMQKASDVTIEAYKAAFATIVPGMSQTLLSNNISAAFRKLGFSGGASVQVGKYAALPHGSITPQTIQEGDVVMIDGGTRDRKSTRLNSSHVALSRMPSSA